MKLIPLLFCLVLFSCAMPKETTVVNNTQIFTKHPPPYHVFSIGNWNSDYLVLTLIDNKNNYFTIKAINDPSLKKGSIYTPKD